MFSTKDLFAKALGIEEPWFIDRMGFDPLEDKLDILIDFKPDSHFRYVDTEKASMVCSRHTIPPRRPGAT